MSYENTKCPCGDRKPRQTLICETCQAAFGSTVESAAFQNRRLPIAARRAAAIRLLSYSRRRKTTRWPSLAR